MGRQFEHVTPAQNIRNLVVGTLQVFDGHVIPSKCGYPPVSDGI